jgi:undecaprenyl-phosphate 4-deoxy-4-formamido-L-arabinose transferase
MAEQAALSVVVPCYRDEALLPRLLARLGPVLECWPGPAELVLVDDGSPDRTAERARALAAGAGHPLTVVRLARNCGQHAALMTGLEVSRGEVVVTLDSDLRYPPEQIAALTDPLSAESPVVAGVRVGRTDPRSRRAVTRLLSWWIGRRSGTHVRDVGCMFRAYERGVVEQLVALRDPRPFISAMTARLGVTVTEVPISETGDASETRYSRAALVRLFLDAIRSPSRRQPPPSGSGPFEIADLTEHEPASQSGSRSRVLR